MSKSYTIFLDESGELGFDWNKKKTSEYFVISLLVCKSNDIPKKFKTAVKRTLKNKINKTRKKRPMAELKGSKLPINSKSYFLDKCPKGGWEIYSYILVKKNVNEPLRKSKPRLYNYLAAQLLKKVPLHEVGTINLTMDKCKSSEEIKDFNGYLENQLQGMLEPSQNLYISHLSSQESHGIQAVDLFCWGIYRKYSSKDVAWYNMYKSYIKLEDKFFNKKG